MRILPLGLAVSVVILGGGAFVFLVPVPEGDLWHGQGTLIAKILMRVVIRRRMGRIYVRLMSRMGEDKEETHEQDKTKKTGRRKK